MVGNGFKIGVCVYSGIALGLGGSYYMIERANSVDLDSMHARVEHQRLVEEADSLDSYLKGFSIANSGSIDEYLRVHGELYKARSEASRIERSVEFGEYEDAVRDSTKNILYALFFSVGGPLAGMLGALKIAKPEKKH